MDGVHMPAASDWKNGPGNLVANPAPWAEVKPRYAFVDELAALRSQVNGPGNLERFDYWLNTWRGMTAMAEACCVRGQLDKAMAAKTHDQALTNRIELARVWSRLLTLQTAIVSTPGELGTIANLEQHTRRESHFLDTHDAALSKAIGASLPAEAAPAQSYTGPAKLIVPTVRSEVTRGEVLKLKIIALDQRPAKSVVLKLRPLGGEGWQEIPARHLARAVFEANLPAARDDFEYFITAETGAGARLVWPATAPEINQTVVVAEENP
jgi:hypothetical protein